MPTEEYKRHHSIIGLAIFFLILGLVIIFFNWKIGLGISVVGLLLRIYGNFIKQKTINKFLDSIFYNIDLNNPKDGMTNLCQHYIVGTIGLLGDKVSANWPNFPSIDYFGQNLPLIPEQSRPLIWLHKVLQFANFQK